MMSFVFGSEPWKYFQRWILRTNIYICYLVCFWCHKCSKLIIRQSQNNNQQIHRWLVDKCQHYVMARRCKPIDSIQKPHSLTKPDTAKTNPFCQSYQGNRITVQQKHFWAICLVSIVNQYFKFRQYCKGDSPPGFFFCATHRSEYLVQCVRFSHLRTDISFFFFFFLFFSCCSSFFQVLALDELLDYFWVYFILVGRIIWSVEGQRRNLSAIVRVVLRWHCVILFVGPP